MFPVSVIWKTSKYLAQNKQHCCSVSRRMRRSSDFVRIKLCWLSTHTGDAAVVSKAGQAVHSTWKYIMRFQGNRARARHKCHFSAAKSRSSSVICGLEIKSLWSEFVRCDAMMSPAGKKSWCLGGCSSRCSVCKLKICTPPRPQSITSYLPAAAIKQAGG
jgi:hypothetical protein